MLPPLQLQSRVALGRKDFAVAVAGYINHGATAECILAHVQDCTQRPLDIKAAKEMVAKRGSCAKVIAKKTA